MKKILGIGILCSVLLVALICSACTGTHLTNNSNTTSSNSFQNNLEPRSYEELESVEFDSMEDYIEYMTEKTVSEYNETVGTSNTESVTVLYYAPSSLPEGARIVNIRVNDEGTIFTYSLRNNPAVKLSLLTIDTDDESLIELFETARTKIYNSAGIADKYSYAARLANAIRAYQLYPGQGHPTEDEYLGNVPVKYRDSNGVIQTTIVGNQRVKINSHGDVQYDYWPTSVSEGYADQLELVLQSVTVDTNGFD